MVEDISLSVEETNKLRVSIGLPPIPVENEGADLNRGNQKDSGNQLNSTAKNELSIEDTNKLRKSLGLAPIEAPIEVSKEVVESQLDTVEKQEWHNFQNFQAKQEAQEQDKRLKLRIADKNDELKQKKVLNRNRALQESFQQQFEDFDSWLDRLGGKDDKGIDNQDGNKVGNSNQVGRFGGGALTGQKVGHTLKEMGNLGDAEILTLKDTDVLADEDDELQNEALVYNKRKRETHDYSGSENYIDPDEGVEEEEDANNYSKQGLKIEDGMIRIQNDSERSSKVDSKPSKKVEIAYLFNIEDYDVDSQTVEPSSDKKSVKMKKLKKKSLSGKKRKRESSKEIEEENVNEYKLENVDLSVANQDDVLDEELGFQELLSKRRKGKLQSRKYMTPEEIAREVSLNKRWELENQVEAQTSLGRIPKGGFAYDDTNDFLNSLKPDLLNQSFHSNLLNPDPKPIDRATTDIKSGDDSQHTNDSTTETPEPSEAFNTPTFSNGLASTLKFLKSQNVIELSSSTLAELARAKQEAAKQADLLKLKISIERRLVEEELEADKSFMNLPKTERQTIIDEILDQRLKEKNISLSSLTSIKSSNYKPTVKLSYKDESGQNLDTKEAFKYLSHKFHGVGPGKAKIEKKLKKLKQSNDRKNSQSSQIL